MMNKAVKLSLVMAAVCATIAAVLYLRSTRQRPACDCFYPNTGVYGVKSDGVCAETDCEPPKSRVKSK